MSEIRKNSHFLCISFLLDAVYPLVFFYTLELEFSCLLVSLQRYFLFLLYVFREERKQMFNSTILKQEALYLIFDPGSPFLDMSFFFAPF